MTAIVTPDWGGWLLGLATVCALVQAAVGFRAGVVARAQDVGPDVGVGPDLGQGVDLGVARRCALVGFVATAAAFGVLIAAFVTSDFSVQAVAMYSHVDKPLIYKIAGAWGNHEGSMVMWCVVLSGVGALLARRTGQNRALGPAIVTTALGVVGALSAVFLLYTVIVSNPFSRLVEPPWSGAGFNPLLQDPAVALHPPLLYLGYVGLAAPFALACAVLVHAPNGGARANATTQRDRVQHVEGQSVEERAPKNQSAQLQRAQVQAWAGAMRGWTLCAFAALTLGIGLGGYWAYYELGWGGWWAWDPVENASLMPWIFAAALFHSAMVTQRRNRLASWTIVLAIIAFSLSLLGTFLTRSGAVTSVHAFANDPARGLVLLGILALVLVGALALFAGRAERLATTAGQVGQIAVSSREGLLVANNLFLVVAALVVLTGTLMPLFAEALGQPVSVGPPYYEKAALPMVALGFVLTPFATMAGWGRALLWPQRWLIGTVAAAFGAVVVAMLTLGAPLGAGVAVALGLWLIGGALLDVRAKVSWGASGRGASGKEAAGRSAARLAWARPQIFGAALAHFGLGLVTIGGAAESAFQSSRTVVLRPGQSVQTGLGAIRLDTVTEIDGPNYTAAVGSLAVDTGADDSGAPGSGTPDSGSPDSGAQGRSLAFAPEWRRYWVRDQNTSEVDIRSGVLGDVYVAFGPPQLTEGQDVAWTVRVLEKPLIWMVFAGIAMVAGGAGLAARGAWRSPMVGGDKNGG